MATAHQPTKPRTQKKSNKFKVRTRPALPSFLSLLHFPPISQANFSSELSPPTPTRQRKVPSFNSKCPLITSMPTTQIYSSSSLTLSLLSTTPTLTSSMKSQAAPQRTKTKFRNPLICATLPLPSSLLRLQAKSLNIWAFVEGPSCSNCRNMLRITQTVSQDQLKKSKLIVNVMVALATIARPSSLFLTVTAGVRIM